MRHFLTILNQEIRMLLVNPSTYIAAVLFLAVMGFVFTGILENYSASPQEASPAIVFFQYFWTSPNNTISVPAMPTATTTKSPTRNWSCRSDM